MRTLANFCAINLILMVALTADYSAQAADLTWDPGQTGSSDGAGTWLNPNVWDNGGPATWTSGDNATIGNGGTGATITLGAVVAGTVTFTNFSGTYTLNSGSLTNSGGITLSSSAGNVTVNSLIGGTGGLTINGDPGTTFFLMNTGNSYTGPTVVNGGILACGTAWQSAQSLPGGIGAATDGSNLEINGGNFRIAYYLRRTLGAGPGQLQITGGTSGFSHIQADTYGRISINNDINYEVVWGSDYFKPDVLVLNEAAASPTQVVNFQNKLDLNGSTRTVACNSTGSLSARVDANNGLMDTAGGRFTGVIGNSGVTPAGIIKTGPGHLQLTAANTYDGDTWVKQGMLGIYGADNRIPTNSLLTLGDGTNNATFMLSGRSQVLNSGLLTSGTGTSNSIVNGSTTEGTLTVNVASGVNTFSGIIGGSTANENLFNFTKTGAGELSVRQFNNSRITSVQEGVLRVTESYGPDTKISISAGATNILDFTGIYAIHSLLLDGTPATAGTWGGPLSGAPNTSTLLDGTGKLSIAGDYSTYFWDGPNVGGIGDGAGAGGSGTWSTSTDNWDVGLTERRVWPSTPTNIDAVFAGATGLVTLTESLNVSNVTITGNAANYYTLAGGSMTFASGGSLTIGSSLGGNWFAPVKTTSAISNSPSVALNTAGNIETIFAPTSGTVALGAVSGGGLIQLSGSTTGNVIASSNPNKIRVTGGEWTLTGNARAFQHWVNYGTLIVDDGATLTATDNKGINLSTNATLVVNGTVGDATTRGISFAGSGEGASPWNVAKPGGTLTGTGVVNQTVTLNVLAQATVAPGYPVGTLTVTNCDCTIAGTLAISFSGAECSRLLVDGILDISAGTSTLDVNTDGASGTEFIIATFDGLTGSAFAATNNLPSSWAVVYEATQIKLVPPPSGTVIMLR